MNILLTGGKGLLASTIKEVGGLNHNIENPGKDILDVTNNSSVMNYIGKHKNKIDIIVHCAAIIGYDKCESNKRSAYDVNYKGTRILSQFCNDIPKPMIYISTDYVFDGERGNYSEEDYTNPLTYYAKTKLMGEIAALSNGHRVIRTSFCKPVWPYDNAYVDKYSSFDTVNVIAGLILKVCCRIWSWNDILHVGTERKTFYEMAKRSKQIKGISILDFKTPKDTSFNLSKMNMVLEKQESY